MKTLLTLIFLFLSLGLVVAQTAVQSTSFEKKTFLNIFWENIFQKKQDRPKKKTILINKTSTLQRI